MRRYVAIALSSVLGLQVAPPFVASASAAPPVLGTRVGGAQAPAATGSIQGTAKSVEGQLLPRQAVQLRNLDTGQVTATSASNGQGAFSFAGVAPGNYAVEIVNSTGTVVGTSAAASIAPGAPTMMTVAATTSLQGAGAAAGAGAAGAATGGTGIGLSTALIVTTVAVAAGVAGVVVVARDNPSPSN